MPLLRELRELAGRALIPLPNEVDDPAGAVPTTVRGRWSVSSPKAPDGGRAAAGNGDHGELTDALRLAGPNEPRPRRDTFGLSSREREVLVQIARGRTNREIGERLFISQKTVGVHVGNILAKLGVSGRVEAAAVAIRLGLTDDAVGQKARPGGRSPGLE